MTNNTLYHADDLSSIDLQKLKEVTHWQAQFRLITQWSTLISEKPELRKEQNRIKGCETAAWLAHQREGEVHYFYFDSDSKIIRGLAAIALSLTHGKTREEIRQNDIDHLLQDSGIRKHLTPSRSNGFRAILQRIEVLSSDNV